MSSALVALLCAIAGVVPLLIGTEIVAAVIMAVIYFLLGWLFIYIGAPSTVYPLLGWFGFMAFCWLAISSFIDAVIYSENTRGRIFSFGWILPVVAAVTYLLLSIGNSPMFNARGYAAMLGEPETRIWTQDIQPKDPKHMLMGSEENALYQADKALGQFKDSNSDQSKKALGSQFQVDRESVTLQKINDQWFYVVPLEYVGPLVYLFGHTGGIPAYIKVSAEDPNRQAELVQLKDKMKYAPSAYFGTYLKRHMRYNGYLNSDMYEYLFEIDDEGNPWWVVPVFKPQLGWWGEKITEIAQINPATGEIQRISMDQIPSWMDRAFPGELAQNYLTWHGTYYDGWLNTFAGNLSVAKKPILIYGADKEPYWVCGITSSNTKDSSLISLAYTDARTGKTVLYDISGGLTEESVLGAVNSNKEVSFKKLHGVNPQIYNCYGTVASVVPLLNENHIFQSVAIVNIKSQGDQIAVGDNQEQALRKYQGILNQSGQQIAIDKTRMVAVMDGKIVRVGFDHANNVYYLMVDQSPGHLFTLNATEHPELPVTQPGDAVHFEYENSGEKVMPVVEFSNLAVPLVGTPDEAAVKAQADARREQEEVRQAAPTVQQNLRERLDKMTPEQLQQLEQQVNAVPAGK